MPPKIAVVGSSVMDLTTYSPKFPAAGETILADRFDLGFGGKGANQAVATRLCGAEVAMVSCVGEDAFGPATIENFKRFGIDTSQVHAVAGEVTGAATILVDPHSGQNRILVALGACAASHTGDCRAGSCHAKAIAMHRHAMRNAARHGLSHDRTGQRHGIVSILNVAPAQPIDLGRLDGLDYLIVNETEAETISGQSVQDRRQAKNGDACWPPPASSR